MRHDLDFTKKFTAAIVLALFISQTSLPAWEGTLRAWAAVRVDDAGAGLSVLATLKDEVGQSDENLLDMNDETTRKANVLFMIEATAGMQFSSKSVMPSVVLANRPSWRDSGRPGGNWPATHKSYGYTVDNVIDMMKGATFGIGAMPVAWSGADLRVERNLYGRDVDASNNYVKMSDDPEEDLRLNALEGRNYHVPFAKSDTGSDKEAIERIKEGYKEQARSLHVGHTGYGNASDVGSTNVDISSTELGSYVTKYSYKGNNKITGANNFPYALVFKNPAYWEKGMESLPIGQSPAPDASKKDSADTELVPNDSRLYQAKLVLWKLLEEGDKWSNIRFGLATTYLPTTSDTKFTREHLHTGLYDRYDFNGMYKVWPFGANVWTSKKFKDVGGVPTPDPVENSGWPDDNNLVNRKQFKNGILVQAISGHPRVYNSIHAQFYPMWSHMTVEPIYSSIQGSNSTEIMRMKRVYKLLHRGSLLVPIRGYDDTWSSGSKPVMSHADRFRQWINGFADINNGRTDKQVAAPDRRIESGILNNTEHPYETTPERDNRWHFYKDPEIGVAGVFILPHAIYPDPRSGYGMTREDYKKKILTTGVEIDGDSSGDTNEQHATAVWYSNKNSNTDYYYWCFPGSTEFEEPETEIKNHFNAGSGEAAGSVLDFFSPPTDKYSDLGETSYPIRSACDPNWVIVVTTGQELKPALVDDDGNPLNSYTYTTAQAIKNLYDATDKSRGNKNGSKANDNPLKGEETYADYEQVSMLLRNADGTPIGSPELVDLDDPIRTLVVGIVPDINKMPQGTAGSTERAEYDTVKEMYVNLAKMALAGRGENPDIIENYDDIATKAKYKAFIADNPEGLTDAIMNALTVINDSTVVQPGSGAMAQSEALDDLDGRSDIYSYQYRIMRSNQWEASMTREIVSMDADGTVSIHRKWTIGEEYDTKIIKNNISRNVRYWNEGWNYSNLVELKSNLTGFGNLSGILSGDILPPPGRDYGGVHPYEAYAKWLQGKDFSYSDKKEYLRSHMFTDLGQGGVVMVNDVPEVAGNDTPPGYKAWAENATPQSPVLYAQTNDGLLRMIDPTQTGGGNEVMAILPPPMLIPRRLAALVTNPSVDGKRRWLEISGPEEMGGYRSYPAFTLDGSLQKRNFNLNQTDNESGWGKYMLGALGRGGSGLYMLDVSDHDAPKMLWYREGVGGNKLISSQAPPSYSTGTAYVYDEGELTDKEKGYLKLGFNSPRPVMGIVPFPTNSGKQNFIALAGGAMSDVPIDLNKNGKEGASLLMIEPKDGTILRAFDGSSFNESNWMLSGTVIGKSPIMGMMVSEPTAFRSGSGPYLTGGIIAADNRGNIFRIDLEDPQTHSAREPKDWSIRTIGTLQTAADSVAGSEKSYAMPHGVAVLRQSNGSVLWIAGGTSDIKVKKAAMGDNGEGILENERQMIFSFMTNSAQTKPYTRDDFKQLDPENPADIFSINSENSKSGWHFPLREAGQNDFPEYVSAKPVLINGTLFIATFKRQNKTQPEDSSRCEPDRVLDGESRLYAVDIRTGKPTTWTGVDGHTPTKYETFKHVKIAGITDLAKGGKGKLMIHYDILSSENNLNEVRARQPKLRNIKSYSGAATGGRPGEGGSGGGSGGGIGGKGTNYDTLEEPEGKGGSGVPPETTVINYWLIK
jgi:hypothetical protein